MRIVWRSECLVTSRETNENDQRVTTSGWAEQLSLHSLASLSPDSWRWPTVIVSEMTYNVSMGTLNPTWPTVTSWARLITLIWDGPTESPSLSRRRRRLSPQGSTPPSLELQRPSLCNVLERTHAAINNCRGLDCHGRLHAAWCSWNSLSTTTIYSDWMVLNR